MLSRPPVLGFQVYLAENFNNPNSLSNFPTFARFRRSGVRISDTSCGGQPDDVAMLRAPNSAGYEYLFQSDRWDNKDQNEGQATQYWEPMKFNADGSLKGLTCGVQHTAVLTDAVLSQTPPSVDGFTEAQDITSTHSRGQSFQVSTAANLTSVALTLFQTDVGGNAPDPRRPDRVAVRRRWPQRRAEQCRAARAGDSRAVDSQLVHRPLTRPPAAPLSPTRTARRTSTQSC